MKGLEQAVNIKLWPGNGEPVKAWGKLKRVREHQIFMSIASEPKTKSQNIRVWEADINHSRTLSSGTNAATH